MNTFENYRDAMQVHWIVSVDCTKDHPSSRHHVSTEQEMLKTVHQIASQREGSFSLSPYGLGFDQESLLCGIAGDFAFAHFIPRHPSDPRMPLWATSCQGKTGTFVDFNVGGTLTEVPTHRCIPTNLLIEICKHYFATLSLLSSIRWELHWSLDSDNNRSVQQPNLTEFDAQTGGNLE
jgi:hypothetical protein